MKLAPSNLNAVSQYFDMVLAYVVNKQELRPDLTGRIAKLKLAISNEQVIESQVDELIADVVDELNEPMYVWKMLAAYSQIPLIEQPISSHLANSPDLKVMMRELFNLKLLLFPPTYQLQFYWRANQVVVEVDVLKTKREIQFYKQDNAITYLLFCIRNLVGYKFDFSEILIPVDREKFELSIVREVTQAKISRQDGPCTVVMEGDCLSYKNPNFNEDKWLSGKLAIEKRIQELKSSTVVSDKVLNYLRNKEQVLTVDIEQVASSFNVDARIIVSRLKGEDTTFEDLKQNYINRNVLKKLLNTTEKIASIASYFGFESTANFEQFFKSQYGEHPIKFRLKRKRLLKDHYWFDIVALVNSLPPLNQSCRDILSMSQNNNLDLESVVSIIEKDVVFKAKIMGLANKSVYGLPPKNLEVAIGRNIGLQQVVNLAVMYSASESLTEIFDQPEIESFFHACMLVPRIMKLMNLNNENYDHKISEQGVMFCALGMLVLFNPKYLHHHEVQFIFEFSESYPDFSETIQNQLGLSLYAVSNLLLSIWGLDGAVIRCISNFDEYQEYYSDIVATVYSLLFKLIFQKGTHTQLVDASYPIGVSPAQMRDIEMSLHNWYNS